MARLVQDDRTTASVSAAQVCIMSNESENGVAESQANSSVCPFELHFRNRILGALETAGYRELRSVRCHVSKEVVVLRGVLPSYHLKQLAQQAILALEDRRVVKNLIDVSSAGVVADFQRDPGAPLSRGQ